MSKQMSSIEVYEFLYKKLKINGKNCIDAMLSVLEFHYVIDIFAFEDELVRLHDYDPNGDESISDFILRKFGENTHKKFIAVLDM